MSTLFDYIEKVVAELHNGIRWKSYEKMEIELEKLTTLLEFLKSHFPRKVAEATFEHIDRHLHYVKRYVEERNLEMVKQNFDDIRQRDLPKIKSQIPALPEVKKTTTQKAIVPLSKNVFIVHGRDHRPLKELKSMLVGFGLNPIVLHEKPSGSRTIVEKLEKYSDVGYVFVILTPDDVGSSFDALFTSPRARQNVVLEFGYFIGLLSRDRVCCLYKGEVELPSDMQGIVYIPFGESVNECRDKIVSELKEAGYDIRT